MNGTLECPPQEGPHPYQDLPGGFSKHLQDAPFPPWIIGRGSMTAWEAGIVAEGWAREWSRWCSATRAPETPAQGYAAIPLEGWGPDTRLRPTVLRGAGPDHPWDAATGNGCKQPRGRKQDGLRTCPHSSGHPSHPASSFTPPTYSGIQRYANGDTPRPPSGGTPQWTGPPSSPWRTSKHGGPVYDDAPSRLGDNQGPLLLMLPTDIAAALRQELDGCEGLRVGWEAVGDGTLLDPTRPRPRGQPARPGKEGQAHAHTYGTRVWRPPTYKGRCRSPHKRAPVHQPSPSSNDGRYGKPDASVTGSTHAKPPQRTQPKTGAGGTGQGQPHRGAPIGYDAERAQRPCLGGGQRQAQ